MYTVSIKRKGENGKFQGGETKAYESELIAFNAFQNLVKENCRPLCVGFPVSITMSEGKTIYATFQIR